MMVSYLNACKFILPLALCSGIFFHSSESNAASDRPASRSERRVTQKKEASKSRKNDTRIANLTPKEQIKALRNNIINAPSADLTDTQKETLLSVISEMMTCPRGKWILENTEPHLKFKAVDIQGTASGFYTSIWSCYHTI